MAEIPGVIALVPMKAHSERIPNKNLRAFAGRPLYHHVVQTLLQCPHVEGVVIDTDGEEIARDVRSRFPAKVRLIPRPPAIQGDFVSMNVIIQHDLSQVEGAYFLQTHSTNPLLRSSTVTRAIERFFEGEAYDSLFGVTRIQSRLYNREGNPINHDPREMLRTQDLPPVYNENSNLYCFSRKSFQKSGRRIGERPFLFEMPKLEAMDIDDEADFRLAECVYQSQQLAGVR